MLNQRCHAIIRFVSLMKEFRSFDAFNTLCLTVFTVLEFNSEIRRRELYNRAD